MAFKWGIERWVEDKQEEWLQQGIEQGLEQGLHRGIGQGRGLLLQKLLSKRFGDLSPEMVQKIRSAEPKEIELWGDRVLDAPSLQAVFLPLTDREFALAFKWGVERWVEGKQKERFQQGIEQGREQGFHRGIGQGEGLLLQRLLSKRFGVLPPEMVQMIRSAEPKEIEIWGERVLDAPSLQAVFHPSH
jgi:flagellar biosynthesis/type III secretory pathway protein FliH